MANVTARPHWLSTKNEALLKPKAGTKLCDLLPNKLMERIKLLGGYCQINGESKQDWLDYKVEDKDVIFIGVNPAGADGSSERSQNKQLINTIIIIAAVIATQGSAWAVAHPYLYAGAVAAGSVALGLINRSEIAIPEPASFDQSQDEYYSLSGNKNQVKPWGRIPRIYGKIRVFPNLAYIPIQDFQAETSFLDQVFDFGYSELEISDIRIGSTDIDLLEGVDYEVHKNVVGPKNFGLSSLSTTIASRYEMFWNYEVERNIGKGSLGTQISFFMPTNMVYFEIGDNKYYGAPQRHMLNLKYSEDGGTTWKDWTRASGYMAWISTNNGIYELDDLTLTNNVHMGDGNFTLDPSAFPHEEYREYKETSLTRTLYFNNKPHFTPAPIPKDISIKITYLGILNADNFYLKGFNLPYHTSSPIDPGRLAWSREYYRWNYGYDNVKHQTYPFILDWKVYTNKPVSNTLVPHSMLSMRIEANKQLNGAVDDLTALAHSILRVWYYDTPSKTWKFKKELSQNPAWIFVDILTSDAVNKKAIIPLGEAHQRIDLEEMVEWAKECEANNYECNIVFSDPATIKSCLTIVAGIGRAVPVQPDGVFSVVRESKSRLPVQLVTPKNSSNFTADINYKEEAQGLSIEYLDEELDYKPTKEILYVNGYDATTAIDIDTFSLRGVTNRDLAYRFAYSWLAEYKLRRERIVFNMDIENIVATRGDIVRVAHDILNVGGQFLRVKNVTGNTITFDESPVSAIKAIRRRLSNDIIPVVVTGEFTVTAPTGHPIKFDDLVEYGVTSSIVADYVIMNVRPGNDFTATITALEHRPEIIDAGLNAEIPERIPKPGYDGYHFISPPTGLYIHDYDVIIDREGYRKVNIKWDMPSEGYPTYYKVYDLTLDPPFLLGTTKNRNYFRDNIPLSYLNNNILSVIYGVTAVNNEGDESAIAKVHKDLALNKAFPDDVVGFGSNILTTTIHLFWNKVFNPDNDFYEIRYSPSTANPKWDESTFVTSEASFNQTSITIPARTGSYLIKAVNTAGLYSENAAITVTHVDVLPHINLTSIYKFDPFTKGYSLDGGTKLVGNRLLLKDNYYIGWWISDQTIDFGTSPWTMRLTSQVQMQSHDHDEHLDQPWFTPLATAIPLSPTASQGRNKIDAQIYYLREKENFSSDVLADPWYTPLSTAKPLIGYNSPFGPGHTGWQRLISTDVTSNKIYFAIKITTSDLNFIPAVTNASVLVDWVERTEKGDNVTVPAIGKVDIKYQYKYAEIKGPIKKPVVTVSLEHADPGDTVSIIETVLPMKTTLPWNEGFTVLVVDKDGNPKAGQIDWQSLGVGKGY